MQGNKGEWNNRNSDVQGVFARKRAICQDCRKKFDVRPWDDKFKREHCPKCRKDYKDEIL